MTAEGSVFDSHPLAVVVWSLFFHIEPHVVASPSPSSETFKRNYHNNVFITSLTVLLLGQLSTQTLWWYTVKSLPLHYATLRCACRRRDRNPNRHLHKQQLKAPLGLFFLIAGEAADLLPTTNACWCEFAMIKAAAPSPAPPTGSTEPPQKKKKKKKKSGRFLSQKIDSDGFPLVSASSSPAREGDVPQVIGGDAVCDWWD